MPRRLERHALKSPFFRLLDTDSHTAVNRDCDGRLPIDYGVLTEQDALSGRETPRHGSRLGNEPMSLPVGAVCSRTRIDSEVCQA